MLRAETQNCATQCGTSNPCHNFSFTTEIHTQFKCACSQHAHVHEANRGPRR